MSEHTEQKLTPWKKVFLYYPQRVQLLVMATMNLVFILVNEFGVDLSATLVGALNGFVLAGLVFFYGEHMTHSKQAVEDFFHYEASPDSEAEYEAHGIDVPLDEPEPEPEPAPPPPPVKKAAAKKSTAKKSTAKKSTAKKSTAKKSAPKKKANP